MRGRNEGSIFLDRSRDRWVAMVSWPDGSRHKKLAPTHDNSRAGARRLLPDLLRDRDAARDPEASSPLGPFLRRWLDEVRPALRPSTFRTYAQIVNDHLVPALGKVTLAALSVPTVQAYLRRKGEKLSPQTVGHHRAVLRAALAMAQRWGILTRNVAGLADAPRVERRELTVLDAEQIRKLFATSRDDRLHALWVLAATTGMRQAELLGLTWRYAKGGVVRVERTLARIDGRWVMVEPKTKLSRRTIPLTPVAVAALSRHHAGQQREWLAAGRRGKKDDDRLVFMTAAGQPCQGGEILRDFHRALKAAGLPIVRFHDLRHGTATMLLAAGFSLEDVKNLLGHSTIALTSNTYGHYLERRGREVAAGMERAVGGRS